MILVLRPDATEEQFAALVHRIESLGYRAHVSQGQHRTIVGVIGEEQKPHIEALSVMPGVE
jgi:3-deoxy-7-phosphoheptulonate synthase